MSDILLDTHFLIWLIKDPVRVSAAERTIITAPHTRLFLSAVSIWELRTKWHLRRPDGSRRGEVPPDEGIAYALANHIALVPLTAQDGAIDLAVPSPNRDPFDEMLLVHAQRLGARLLTRDGKLLAHPLAFQA